MFFEWSYSSFCFRYISSMHVWYYDLVACTPIFHNCILEFSTDFVVQYLDLYMMTPIGYFLHDGVVCPDPVLFFSIYKGGLQNCVVITIIYNHYVLIYTSLSDLESATIISVEFTDGLIPYVEFLGFLSWWNILCLRLLL